MAVPPKLPMLSFVPPVVVPAIVPGDDLLLPLPDLPKPPAFDFAPFPVPPRKPVLKRAKPQPRTASAARSRALDLSPRLELRVTVEREEVNS